MGFLNFLKKGKKEEIRDEGLEIPLPPTMADDLGDVSDLPSLSDDKDQGIPLPPLEPLDTIDRKYFDDFKMPDEKQPPLAQKPAAFRDISKQYDRLPPVPPNQPVLPDAAPKGFGPGTEGDFMLPKQFDYNPFKEEMLRRQKGMPDAGKQFGMEIPKKQAHRERFVRADHFWAVMGSIENVKAASEMNKSIANLKKLKISSDREFDRLHSSLEDAQRSLFYIDQELFEEG